MKKIEIVSNKTNKRDAGSFLLFVFLLPYVCACLWGHVGEEAEALQRGNEGHSGYVVEALVEWGVWELPVDEYLAYQLFLTMPTDYEMEAKKAQAVLLRTELASMYEENGGEKITVDGGGLAELYRERDQEKEEALRVCRRAVKETEGEILTYIGKPIRASYFKVSNGRTRSAKEAGEKNCPYLSTVICEQDKSAQEFQSVVKVERNVYIEMLSRILGEGYEEEEIWEDGIFSFDSAGYMTNVSYKNGEGETIRVDGENFRHIFGLASASFEMNREEERVVFYVTGVGHGFGMSQYAADCKAKEGMDYEKILTAFFFQTELAKFEYSGKIG